MDAVILRPRGALGLFVDRPEPRLYDRIVDVLRTGHYSRHTEDRKSVV